MEVVGSCKNWVGASGTGGTGRNQGKLLVIWVKQVGSGCK